MQIFASYKKCDPMEPLVMSHRERILLTSHFFLKDSTANYSETTKGTVEIPPMLGRNLSAAEKRVLNLVSLAKTNKEIAAALNISPATVKRHLENILRKLQL